MSQGEANAPTPNEDDVIMFSRAQADVYMMYEQQMIALADVLRSFMTFYEASGHTLDAGLYQSAVDVLAKTDAMRQF